MIDLSKSGTVWTITINRPEKANSLTENMLKRLVEIANEAETARALIITGAGKVFSAGADIDEARAGLAASPLWEELSSQVAALPCLTIAALNGTLAGGAFGMALACDLRISTERANFFYPVMKHGFLPQPSDPSRMQALIGPSRTKMVLLAGQKLTAHEAHKYGLIDRIVDAEELLTTANDITTDFVSAPEKIASEIKKMCAASSVSN